MQKTRGRERERNVDGILPVHSHNTRNRSKSPISYANEPSNKKRMISPLASPSRSDQNIDESLPLLSSSPSASASASTLTITQKTGLEIELQENDSETNFSFEPYQLASSNTTSILKHKKATIQIPTDHNNK